LRRSRPRRQAWYIHEPVSALQAQQLELPLGGVIASSEPARIPRQRRIFVNRNLRMTHVSWVGFDMDYTLAIYHQQELDRLSIESTLPKLEKRGYPSELLRRTTYHPEFAIRGLLVDKKLGNVLKMDRFKVVQKGYHGLTPISKEDLRTLYHQRRLRPASARYHWIDTLYALSEATMFACLVDAFDRDGVPVDYAKLFLDIRESIDEAHADGTILRAIEADLPRFVDRDPNLAPTLHKLRSAGKKLFLLTNSRWSYTERMMSYLLGGAMPEYPSFSHYFDVLVVEAKKPAFFQERRALQQRVVHPTGAVELRPATFPLERGVIYEGGNLVDLERLIGTPGDKILYVGDHIYGDILRSKKESAWRTAMIIQEMEAEMGAHEECSDDLVTIEELEERREELEDQLRFHQGRFKDLTRRIEELVSSRRRAGDETPTVEDPAATLSTLDADRVRAKRAVERIRGQLRAVDAQATTLEQTIDRRFHPYWGSLLKEASETSGFGDQVEEYACLYTSRVSNFLHYSPLQHFRSPRDVMPHEL
jgi:5'-nucleotidase